MNSYHIQLFSDPAGASSPKGDTDVPAGEGHQGAPFEAGGLLVTLGGIQA
jgi:hypothetical protein